MRVVALVHRDLAAAIAALPRQDECTLADGPAACLAGDGALLGAPGAGYLCALDDERLADWAAERGAVFWLEVRPGDFVFPNTAIGRVHPASAGEAAREVLCGSVTLGDERSVEQDIEYAVRQLVEVALRALSPSLNDPFTAIAVLDRLGAALCSLVTRTLPDGRTIRGGTVRVLRPATDYDGLLDAMFHMLREGGAAQSAAMIRMLEVLARVAAVERDPDRRNGLRRHVDLAVDAALDGTTDEAARASIASRHACTLAAFDRATETNKGRA